MIHSQNNQLGKGKALIPIYIRVSSEEQVEKGASLESQLFNARKKAAELGLELLSDYFIDAGVSATRIPLQKRAALQACLKYIIDYKPEYLIVWKRDRLARSNPEYATILKILKKSQTSIIFFGSGEAPFGTGVYGGFQETMILAFAEVESKILSQRILDTRKRLVLQGNWMQGTPPYGYAYDMTNRTYNQVPHEIEVVRKIFELYSEEHMGGIKIAQYLRSIGVRTRKDCYFQNKTIMRLLTNPFYIGYQNLTYLDEIEGKSVRKTVCVRNDQIDPSLSEEIYYKAQEILQRKRVNREPPRHYATSFLLAGLITCANCGHKYVASKSSWQCGKKDAKTRKYFSEYRCSGHTFGIPCYNRIKKEKIESSLILGICETLKTIDFNLVVEEAKKQLAQQIRELLEKRKRLNSLLTDNHNRIQSNQRSFETATSSKLISHYQNRIEYLLNQIDTIQNELENVDSLINQYRETNLENIRQMSGFLDWETVFEQASPENQRAMMLDVIESILYDGIRKEAVVTLKIDKQLFQCFDLSDVPKYSCLEDHSIAKLTFQVKVA